MADHGAPASYLTLGAGVPVLASGGEEVGTVEHVLAAAEEDIFDGLVMSTSHGRCFVDAPQVDEIYERAVVLNIPEGAAAALPEPSANPGAMAADPDDTTPGGLSDKLRRAWDLVSGKY
jgi:hypothetical protein